MKKNNSGKREFGSERNFHPCAFGFAMAVGADHALAALQSSMNVKGGIGTNSLLVKDTAAIIGSLIVVPVVLQKYGQKFSLIIGVILNILLILANFYPVWYTMYSTAFFAGIGMSCAWVGSSVMIQSIASNVDMNQDVDSSSQKYFGMFLAILSLAQVFVNILTELILGWNSIARYIGNFVEGDSNYSSVFASYNLTSDNLLTCGAGDCPIKYSFHQTSGKFSVLIPDQTLLRVLLVVYVLMQMGGVAIHYFFIKGTNEQEISPLDSTPLLAEKKSDFMTSIKKKLKYATSLQELLTCPVKLLFGITMAYIWTEHNRAFVSCVVGVDKVRICTAIINIMSFATSLLISKNSKKIGLPVLFTVGLVYDLINYTCSLLWRPTVSTKFVSYILSVTFGITHGIRRNISFLVTAAHSQDNDTGFTLQLLLLALGGVINTAWSIPLCVSVKIYINISLTVFATFCWSIAKVLLNRDKQT
uniref:protein unc-93 homolog A-like n=1 Tax=Styela clava TaxID=7725 RepID=UPI00193952F2|nr:protein unc-93 homolog A-like [Styela clava]